MDVVCLKLIHCNIYSIKMLLSAALFCLDICMLQNLCLPHFQWLLQNNLVTNSNTRIRLL